MVHLINESMFLFQIRQKLSSYHIESYYKSYESGRFGEQLGEKMSWRTKFYMVNAIRNLANRNEIRRTKMKFGEPKCDL